ncbi:helix-turn-helix domain-containing protein [Alicyclobacillus dauci]|uniref:Helix-turn-helix domain-containing protein n=1 Tax=Alicyclobacillus dauci TaxID=1475485 RepID=A0ABY6ZBM5_9BACL|nr:helix-turn-helix transcriptional regulator [Alicyclobacillus dauci]WAH39521.1 helix-turn-helix domain-containing protein [Alicyclobacillus dauci]WAH39581.1 helix-turn-helix domain-containing protein [Alicyclobacillus dauci]
MDVSARMLRLMRQAAGHRLHYVAQELGISRSYLNLIELGYTTLTPEIKQAYLNLYGVEEQDFRGAI